MSYIPGLFDFDIPNILFDTLLFSNQYIKDASVSCLNRILLFDESEFLFDSEIFCTNFLSAFENEKMESSLEKMLKLLDNVFYFNNQNINTFFIENNILLKLISIIRKKTNKDMIYISFNLISIICKVKLQEKDVILIYQIISELQLQYESFNFYFMKIFYNLLESNSFLYDEFINYKFYKFVIVSLQKGLNPTARYGCKIIQKLIETYECNKFDPFKLLEMLLIDPNDKDEVLCTISVISTLNTFIKHDSEFSSFLLSESSFKNLINLSQNRNAFFKMNMLKIFSSLFEVMPVMNFDIIFTIVNDQNIFHLLSNIIDSDDLEYIKPTLYLICSIFEKSLSLNKIDDCIQYFQAAFNPNIFDFLMNFQDEDLNNLSCRLQSFFSNMQLNQT